MRFNRAYELTIDPAVTPLTVSTDPNIQSKSLLIANPIVKNGTAKNGIGIKFRVERGISSSNNSAEIEIYNLNSTSREFLRQDFFNLPNKNRRLITLNAGYLGNDNQKRIFSQIFYGYLMEGNSGKVGTDIITKLFCQEGGYYNNAPDSFVNQSFNTGVTGQTLLQTLLTSVGLNFGNLQASQETKNLFNNPEPAQVLIGNGFTLLREKYGQTFFVDLNVPCILQNNEVRTGKVPLITSSSGLLGTPFREETKVIVRMLFEPRMILGQAVEIKSTITPEYNGIYKLVGMKHEGTISPSQMGDCVTTLELFIGTQALGGFKTIN